MKIASIVRALNEEMNILEFCQGHQFADVILIADGGSSDQTKKIAGQFENVWIRDFKEQVQTNGTFMNPEPTHLNFLIDWATNWGADWIILDDADSWPTSALQKDARQLLETDKDYVMLYRLYLWRDEVRYFPKVNAAGPCLWAWRSTLGIRWPDGLTLFDTAAPALDISRALILEPPYADLHHFTRNYEAKQKRYAAWGHPQAPLEGGIYWPPEPLPEWAR